MIRSLARALTPALVASVVAVALAAGADVALAQGASAYPTRPITYVIPYPPGGVTDSSARMISAKLAEALKQPVIIDNRPGAGGIIGTAYVARAQPDGYTLLHATAGVLAIAPYVNKVQYDPVRDFTAIANMVSSYTALVVNRNFPGNSVRDLLAYARTNQTFFGSSGQGGITHLIGEMFKSAANMPQIVHVPYKGGGPAMVDLLAGRVHFVFDSQPAERVASGQVKALAVMGPQRLKALPNVPTIHEAGVPNFRGGAAWIGVVGPANLPRDIVNRLSTQLMQIAAQSEFAEKMEAAGVVVTAQDSAAFATQIRQDNESYGAFIRAAGITEEGSGAK